MTTITLHDEQPITATCVPNFFIDEYMTQANGEYVKIYLYLLRSINRSDRSFSLSQIADHFECTERDILRALKYWANKRLFRLEYDEDGSLSGICFVTDTGREDPVVAAKDTAADSPIQAADRFIAATSDKPRPSEGSMEEFCEREDVKELVFIAENYLKRTLNQRDLDIIFFWYDELHLPADLIEYLIETCVAKGHSNLQYMQRIADDYVSRGIRSVDEAKAYTNQSSEVYRAVMKAFGIRGRNLGSSETAYLTKWTGTYGFSEEMIVEACTRTINMIHDPNFIYANSILERWRREGIRTPEDVKKDDEAHQQIRQEKQAAGTKQGSRFHNFTQRDNDYDEIQKKLIQKSFQ